MFDIQPLVIISTGYLLLLFACAWITEKGWFPRRVVQHPVTYVLSLGVYASSWAYYGSTGVAYDFGYAFLAFYFGLSGAFLLAPVLLNPILNIVKKHQLSSLADLFAFRFRSPVAGTISALLLFVTLMPLLALQIQAVSDSIHLITDQSSADTLAIGFCISMMLFTVLFGSRPITSRDHHQGLVFAIAVESLLKMTVILVVGGVILFQVFGGMDGLDTWLNANSKNIFAMNTPLEEGPWRTTLLMFFASAIVMPHMFHMTFTENRDRKTLYAASWGLPLFLLALSISTPLIIWAAIKLNVNTLPEYFPLAIGQALNQRWLTLIVYLGGLSAASSLMIVTTLALSSMMLNHIVLPIYQQIEHVNSEINIYRRVIWLKRGLMIVLIIAAYCFYRLLHDDSDLHKLNIVAYAGALQLLPGALCTLYWERANHKGFISGVLAGTSLWFMTFMLPLAIDIVPLFVEGDRVQSWIVGHWHLAAGAALFVNITVFVTVSLLTRATEAEQRVARACVVQHVTAGAQSVPKAQSALAFQEMLCEPLGKRAAQKEVSRALAELGLKFDEKRPGELARLRDKIESNLSGFMGPTVALEIVNTFLPLDSDKSYIHQDWHFLESRLEVYHSELTGLAAELDSLRRYHRKTLYSIPLGVCAVGHGDILLWNPAMVAMTGLETEQVLGFPVSGLPEPWVSLLGTFIDQDRTSLNKYRIDVEGTLRCFSVHKASIDSEAITMDGNQVLLLEDLTEHQQLEDQLIHSERLASIGQLAAGVAHEIGNPITGIDCLAQELKGFSTDPTIRESAQQILEQTKRVGNIVQMLVSYAHSGQTRQGVTGNAQPVRLYECVGEAMALLQLNAKHDELTFLNRCNPEHWVLAGYQKLQQVFINLLSNAADASPKGGHITVSTTEKRHTVDIVVEDHGHGIPQNIKEKLFDPFFTTKEAGKGTGLGLALAWNIVEAYFGTIRVISPVNEVSHSGTCFIVSLPRIESVHAKQQQEITHSGEWV